jgi:hypothetical protein
MVIKSLKKNMDLKKMSLEKKAKPKANKTVLKSAYDEMSSLKGNSNAYVIIDYPFESENINSCHYAVRVGASCDGYVELSFNDGEWVPCRFNSGYWWFDWTDFVPGEYFISARLIDSKGDVILQTQNRKCKIC